MTSTMRNLVAPLLVTAALLLTLVAGARAAHARKDPPRAARATATTAATGAAAKSGDAPTGSVNLNTATEDELQLLPGIGPSKAAAIVAWRTKHGSFKKVDDLTRVKGFGRKSLLRLRPFLSVTGPTTYRGKKNPAQDVLVGRPPAEEAP